MTRGRPMSRAGARTTAAVVLPLMVSLTACSGSSSGSDVTPRQALGAAKVSLDKAAGVHVVLSTDHLPTGVTGLVNADGVGTHAPAFKGTIKVATSGITADAKVVAADGKVYAVLPFTTQYVAINPGDYGAPDPATLLAPHGGLSSLLTAAQHVIEGKRERDGKQVLTTYAGTVPGAAVAAVIPSADAHRAFDATFRLDGDHRLREAVLTGPFYPRAGKVTYTIDFDRYGVAPAISAPSAGQ